MSCETVSLSSQASSRVNPALLPRISPAIRAYIAQHNSWEDTPEQVRRDIEERFPEPWPTVLSIKTWQSESRKQAEAHRWDYYRASIAEAAPQFISAALMSIRDSLLTADRVRRRADKAAALNEGDTKLQRLALEAARTQNDIACKMLDYCGARPEEGIVDVQALRRGMIEDALAAGVDPAQAEQLVDSLVSNAAKSLSAEEDTSNTDANSPEMAAARRELNESLADEG